MLKLGPLLGLLALAAPALAAEVLPGPIPAEVVSVYDGDTFTARARVWPGLAVTVKVRVRGIDTPELRAKCPEEKRLALAAKELAIRLLGERVRLRDVGRGKYAGRVLAKVETERGQDLGELMIRAGLARTYDGGKRTGWCST